MYLHEIKSPKGSRKSKKIVGRGKGSGLGKTAGRGENGQKSRRGTGKVTASSEGGQMPLIRRLPKMGFRSHRPVLNQIIKVGDLNRFEKGSVVNIDVLKKSGLIKSLNKPFKILSEGDLDKSLTIQVKSISKSAKEKIEKAGGKVEILEKEIINIEKAGK